MAPHAAHTGNGNRYLDSFKPRSFKSLVLYPPVSALQVSPNWSTTGLAMISAALVADAAIGNMQEKEMKQHKASGAEVIYYSYSIGFVYLFAGLLLADSLFSGAQFFKEEPVRRYGSAFLFSASGYAGMQAGCQFNCLPKKSPKFPPKKL